MKAPLQIRVAQWARHLLRIGVLAFIVYAAIGGAWRNYKVAHNSERIVSLIHGEATGTLYAANEQLLSWWGEPLSASLDFLGMPWTLTLFGYSFTDPILVLSHLVSNASVPATLLASLVVPLGLAILLGKVFCSHICPMRLFFEAGQLVRGGLLRLGVPLLELRHEARFGLWVLLGGLAAAFSLGAGVWLLVLPYYGLAAGIVSLILSGAAAGLLWVPGFWLSIDILLAPGFFCKNLCPQGFILEQFGRRSLLRLKNDTRIDCTRGCQTCIRTCPYGLSPRDETHRPACDNCGSCVPSCPKKKLARKFALPMLAALFWCSIPEIASAHHNKGLPHYGYYENYPQVPTNETVNYVGHWEMGATIFNFQGYERRDADTPRDVKFFMYLYDVAADAPYLGKVDFEILLDGLLVTRFARDEVDEESIYSTRETLPESGQYEIVARIPKDGGTETARVYFDIELGESGPNLALIAGIASPVVVLFGLAMLGRTRRGRARRLRPPATISAVLALLGSSLVSLPGRAAQFATVPDPGCQTPDGITPEGSLVMVMPGLPPWLLIGGVLCVILASFIFVERFGAGAPKAWRFNLLKKKPVYSLMRSRWVQALPQLVSVTALFALVYAGLWGNQVSNVTPVFVWTIWWAGLIFAVVILGPIFCFACPWDGLANLLTRLGGLLRVDALSLNLPVPAWLRNTWPALILFSFLTWAELGMGVTTSPARTAYLGLGMAALAVSSALLFEKKAFCQYWCPVGRITGIYSNFSPVEVRARNPKVCARCTTQECQTGNTRGYACPTNISLKVVNHSSYCTGCTECIKSCDKRNVALNLRPFASDLGGTWQPKPHEAALCVGLLVLTLFHGLSMTTFWEDFTPGKTSLLRSMQGNWGTPPWFNFSLGMLGTTTILVAMFWASSKLAARLTRESKLGTRELFLGYSLSLLPVALFYHLAHNAMHLLGEGTSIIPLMSDPLGVGSDYFGTKYLLADHLMSAETLWYLQVALIVTGHVFGVIVAHRASRKLFTDPKLATRSLVPMILLMVLISASGLSLMALDMNMRVGRM